MTQRIRTYLALHTEAAPLAVFRIFFGLLMAVSIVRFASYGWIEKFYIEPDFHFKFYGFDWVQTLGVYTYALFFICGFSAVMVMIGYKYRLSIILFFLSFTYIELMDKTTYLNHYYFISMLSFLMIFLPAGKYFSLDVWLRKKNNPVASAPQFIPTWSIDSIKILLSIVYIYAGLSKLNSDWMFKALPLKIWLPSKFDIPLIGDLMTQEWVHYAFSWFGAGYDLFIPLFLFWRKTRPYAFVMVIIFHVLTRVLFPIGMFPYVMIVSALIFFDAAFHKRIIYAFAKACTYPTHLLESKEILVTKTTSNRFSLAMVTLFLLIQLLLPWRYLLYSGELFWTEEGYRFSWRVMLMEKSGYAQFKIVDGVTGKRFYVDNDDFLTAIQEKQMSFQPDFILEYAHYLRDHFEAQGHQAVQVYVESYVALNGRLSTTFVDPTVDLAQIEDSFAHKTWITPFTDEIKGL